MAPRRKAEEDKIVSAEATPIKRARGRTSTKKVAIEVKKSFQLPSDEFQTIIDTLSGHFSRNAILSGVDKTKSDLMSNLGCAVQDNRGNSSILIGPRASGKSKLVKQVIKDVISTHQTCHIEPILLHGAIFSECQSVLKFLLAKLQQLVKNPTMIDYSTKEGEEFSEFVAFDQLTAMVRQYLGDKNEKRFLVFVLEDLEKFAAHPQQNLLYSLFEMALALPVYVIGVSCRIDVLELLEKRVKSRFSQNIIYLPLPDTEETFRQRISDNLQVSHPQINPILSEFVTGNDSFNKFVNFHYCLSKDVRPIFNVLLLTCAEINSLGPEFDWYSFGSVFSRLLDAQKPYNSLISSVAETTLIELMVITAMSRLASKFPGSPVTFDAMYEELCACKIRAQKLDCFVWTKSMIQIAFDRLMAGRLIIPAVSGAASATMNRSYLTVRLGLPQFLLAEAIQKHPNDNKEITALAIERF